MQIIVIADDRERKSHGIQFLSEMPDVKVEISRLPTGHCLAINYLIFI